MNVFAVQCPNQKCKKYQLVEDHDQGQVVLCLICKTPIKVGATTAPVPAATRPASIKTPPPRK